jgi:hypothetical protein
VNGRTKLTKILELSNKKNKTIQKQKEEALRLRSLNHANIFSRLPIKCLIIAKGQSMANNNNDYRQDTKYIKIDKDK